jgi:elongation of very long chain fatty acids protein 6
MTNWYDLSVMLASIVYLPAVFSYNTSDKLSSHPSRYITIAYSLWNFTLTIFSIWGTVITVPLIVHKWITDGLIVTVCDHDLWHGMMLPAWYFGPSKVVELGDTLFLAVRGKPIRFIQYYHHYITMLYCWHTHYQIGTGMNINVLFCAMNYLVHSLMYAWYTLSSIQIRTPLWVKNMITVLQVIQMWLGLSFIIIANVYGSWYQTDLWGDVFASTMYLSYLVIFGKMLFRLCLT